MTPENIIVGGVVAAMSIFIVVLASVAWYARPQKTGPQQAGKQR